MAIRATRAASGGVTRNTDGIFSPRRRRTSLAIFIVLAVAVFEEVAVTAIMPTISAELDGRSLYAIIFAAPIAAGIAGMVVAGGWSDRSGVRPVMVTAIVILNIGFSLVAIAPNMLVLLTGRLIEGWAAGALTVALYVMVAEHYPARLHRAMFGGFAATFVLPGLIGPLLAGAIAETLGWRWVFALGVVLAIPSFLLMLPALRRRLQPRDITHPPGERRRLGWAVVAGVCLIVLNLASHLPLPAFVGIACLSVAVAVMAGRALLVPGTLAAARGLPTVVLLRGLVGAAFVSVEVYLPLLLAAHYGFGPAAAGLTLTASAVTWAGGAWLQARLDPATLSQIEGIRIGIVLMLVGIAAVTLAPLLDAPPIIVISGWLISGFGMGFTFPRFAVLTLQASTPANRGRNSASLTLAQSIAAPIALAATSVVFLVAGAESTSVAIVYSFLIALGLASLALAVSRRVHPLGA